MGSPFKNEDSIAISVDGVAEQVRQGYNYIHGEFVKYKSDTETYKNINPATGKALGVFPQSTQEDVDKAYDSVREAFPKWKSLSRVARAEYLNRVAELVERDKEKLAMHENSDPGSGVTIPIARCLVRTLGQFCRSSNPGRGFV